MWIMGLNGFNKRGSLNGEQEMDQKFEVRMYSKAELAARYFPHVHPKVGRRSLCRWIQQCPYSVEKFEEMGYRKNRKFFTKREVMVIIEGLGEP